SGHSIKARDVCARLKRRTSLIALRGLGPFAWPKTASHTSQTLGFFVESVNFFIEPCHLGFWLIGAQLFERFANREFSGVSHCKTSPSRNMVSRALPKVFLVY